MDTWKYNETLRRYAQAQRPDRQAVAALRQRLETARTRRQRHRWTRLVPATALAACLALWLLPTKDVPPSRGEKTASRAARPSSLPGDWKPTPRQSSPVATASTADGHPESGVDGLPEPRTRHPRAKTRTKERAHDNLLATTPARFKKSPEEPTHDTFLATRPTRRPRDPRIASASQARPDQDLAQGTVPDTPQRPPGNGPKVASVTRTIALDSADTRQELHFPSGVTFSYQGKGKLTAHDREIQLRWDEGELLADVPPKQGITLTFTTAEATGRVLGTRFLVRIDPVGTHLEVRRGRVEVTCRGEAPVAVDKGNDRVCFNGAAAGLRWARQAWSRGTDPEVVLEAASRALRLTDARSLEAGQLLVLLMRVRATIGDGDGALDAADQFLAAGHTLDRRMVLEFASKLAHETFGCARALPYLDALCDDPARAPVPAVATWVACLRQENPARFRSLLETLQQREDIPQELREIFEQASR